MPDTLLVVYDYPLRMSLSGGALIVIPNTTPRSGLSNYHPFDGRIEAESPRAARRRMKELLGIHSPSGIVYTITELPDDLIRETVDALFHVRKGKADRPEIPLSCAQDNPRPDRGHPPRYTSSNSASEDGSGS
jgi:hypothetical protein